MAAYMLMRSDPARGMDGAREVTHVKWNDFTQLLVDWNDEVEFDQRTFGEYVMQGNGGVIYNDTQTAMERLFTAIVDETSLVRSWEQFDRYIGKHSPAEDLPSVYATLTKALIDCTDYIEDVQDDYTFLYMKAPVAPAVVIRDTSGSMSIDPNTFAPIEPEKVEKVIPVYDPCFI